MFGSSKKLLAVACFTVILIGLVNLAWWVFYDRTQQMLDRQLTRRLLATAKAAAAVLPADVIENLTLGDLDAFANVADITYLVDYLFFGGPPPVGGTTGL